MTGAISKNSQEPLVIYIIADRRSGSTLLDFILSCHPEALSLGELRLLHGHFFKKEAGKRWGWSCSCGLPVPECSFWKNIIDNFQPPVVPETAVQFNTPFLNAIRPMKNLVQKTMVYADSDEAGKKVSENCWNIYQAVFSQTAKKIIIDSSKEAIQAWYLWKYRKGNIKFLLLDRNVSAVAFSKMNRRLENKKRGSIYKDIIKSYKVVQKNHLVKDAIRNDNGDVMVLNYDHLIDDRRQTILSVCDFMGIEHFTSPDHFGGMVQHTIAGTPHRFEKKEIRDDSRWISYYKQNKLPAIISRYFSNKK